MRVYSVPWETPKEEAAPSKPARIGDAVRSSLFH
jgi:hypothetical protein